MTKHFKVTFLGSRMFWNCIPLDSKVSFNPASLWWIVNCYLGRQLKLIANIQGLGTIFRSYWLCWLFFVITEDTIFFKNSSILSFQNKTCRTFFTCCRNNRYQTVVAGCGSDFLACLRNIIICLRWIEMFELLTIYLDRNFWAGSTWNLTS